MEPTKVLVAEDNVDNRQILALRLRHWEAVAVCEATIGQKAQDCIAQAPPDAVLLDLKLPLLDSWETAWRIRALPAPLNALPIIAVTAHVSLEDRDKALGLRDKTLRDIGNNAYISWLDKHLQKPFRGFCLKVLSSEL